MTLTILEQPATEPVSVEDVIMQIRGDLDNITDPVELLEGFITAVRERAEAVTRRALITQSWRLTLDAFPSSRNPIIIPKPPLQTIDAIKYIDTAGAEQTLNPLSYRVVAEGDTGYVMPIYGLSWPVALNDSAVVKVEFTCGYGPIAPSEVNNVPKGIKHWIMINVANLYENRESIGVAYRETKFDLETMADSLIENYRLHRL